MPTDHALGPLTADLVPETADLLAEAFEVDSVYRALFPGPERPAGLRDLFRRNLRAHLPYGVTHVAVRDGRVAATLTVRPPGGIPLGVRAMVRHGLLPFAWAHGPSATRRMLWVKRRYDQLEEEIAGHAPHWYLHMMAVAPRAQGRGLGSEVLREVLRRTVGADRRPIVLTTHLEQNVTFYRRAGFEVVGEDTVRVPGCEPYTVWRMRDRQSLPSSP